MAKKTVACMAVMAMIFGNVSFSPVEIISAANTEVTYETNESVKADDESHLTVHDLSDMSDKTWDFKSSDPKSKSYIEWDSNASVLSLHNVNLSVTNNDVSKWMAYFTCNRSYTVKLYGTNTVALNGNVCFFQSKQGGNITIQTDDDYIAANPKATGELYATMKPMEGSTSKDECHFIESSGTLNIGNTGKGVNLSVTTNGSNVNAYTNIWGKTAINVKESYLCSQMEASSSNLSCNAIATQGDFTIDEKSTLVAKCNVPDTTTPYKTDNNALLISGSYNDTGAKIYLTNVNGHVIGASAINITAASAAKAFEKKEKKEDDEVVGADILVSHSSLNKGGVNDYNSSPVPSGETSNTRYKNDISSLPEDNYLFYSESAYVTDASNFLGLSTNNDTGTNSLAFTTTDADGTYFTHANIDSSKLASGQNVRNKAKTIMSNKSLNLTASSEDATAGVHYDGGDIILSIKGDYDEAKENNKLIIDGKVINPADWSDGIKIDDKYVAVKLEGGTIEMHQDGVYYYILSNEFAQYLGKGEHSVEILTKDGIIKTTIAVPEDDSDTANSVNSSDRYGKIISVTKNSAGDTVYTYDTGTVRVVTYDGNTPKNTTVTWANGNMLVTNPDGTSVFTQPNGSTITYDKDGNITNIYNAGNGSNNGNVNYDPNGGNVVNNVDALNISISSISSGYTKKSLTKDQLTEATKAMANVTPSGKTANIIAGADVTATGSVVAGTDGKYNVQFNVASISAGDNIVIIHKLSNGTWETITPTTIGNGYVIGKFQSFSPVAIIKLTDTAANASTSAKAWDGYITDITSGFIHSPVLNDSAITNAQAFMNSLRGSSTDIYTLKAVTTITKNASTPAGTISLGVTDVKYGDVIKVIAQQYDGSWKEITATVDSNNKVSFQSTLLGNGNIGVIKITKSSTVSNDYTVSVSPSYMYNNDMKALTLTVNAPFNKFLGASNIAIDGKALTNLSDCTVAQSGDKTLVIINPGSLISTVGSHTVLLKFSDNSALCSYTVMDSSNNGNSSSSTATAWDAKITAIAGGYKHNAVTDSVVTSATTALGSLNASNVNSPYTMAAISRITKDTSSVIVSDDVTLTIPDINKTDSVKLLAQNNDGTWKEVVTSVEEDTVNFKFADIASGNVAIVKRSNNSNNSNNNSNNNSESGSSNKNNSSNGSNSSNGGSADLTNNGGDDSSSGSNKNSGSSNTSSGGSSSVTSNGSGNNGLLKDTSSSTSVNSGSGSGNSTANETAGSSNNKSNATVKSAHTGQDPVTMFFTYLLSGLGLKY